MESKVEERFECKGFPCVIMFQPMGFRTGYVGIDKDSVLYGMGCSALDTLLSCHGGITYTGNYLYGQGDPDTWWIGFDCGHAWDGYDIEATKKYFGKDISYKPLYGDEVRTKEYVADECCDLARQIEVLENSGITELDIVIKVMENSFADMSDKTVKYLKLLRDITNVCHDHGFKGIWGIELPNPEKTKVGLEWE